MQTNKDGTYLHECHISKCPFKILVVIGNHNPHKFWFNKNTQTFRLEKNKKLISQL